MPDEFKELVWFLFPSQVLGELLNLKKETFTDLAEIARDKQNELFTTPFKPKDYNRELYKFEFANEYIGNAIEEVSESTSNNSQDKNVSSPPVKGDDIEKKTIVNEE